MQKIKFLLKENVWFLLGFLAIFLIIITNQLHFLYPDEFENILGGWFIINGRLPYTGFFTHHNPMGYFISALAVIFSGPSFVRFRIVFGVFYLFWFAFWYKFVSKQWFNEELSIVKWLIIFLVFSATYTWGHMVLGDSLSAYFLLPSYFILIFSALRKTRITWGIIALVSILSFLSFLSSAAVIIAVGIVYAFLFFLFVKQEGLKLSKVILFLAYIAVPYLVFILYLLVSGSFIEFYRQAIQYTTDIYAKLPGGFTSKNPVRILIIYFNEFIRNYRSILTMVKDLNFGNPFPHALSLSSFVFVAFLILNRKFSLAIFVFFMVVYASVRGNPFKTSETDYQSIQYQFLSMFNGLAAIIYLWNSLSSRKDLLPKKILEGFMFLFLSIYMVFLFFLFFDKWWEKTYLKYMGQQPLIYDRPPIATTLNDLILPDEYYFIGPFDFQDQLYMKSKPASKYIVVLPGMDESPSIQEEMIKDLSSHKPKIIVFNTEYIFFSMQKPPGGFLMPFLHQNYVNLETLGLSKEGYSFKYKQLGEYDFERHFFILKDKKVDIINKMIEKGYVIPP